MNQRLKLQKQQLQQALNCADIIESCDAAIEVGRHLNYYNSLRTGAIEKYIEVVSQIVESSIELSEAKSISDNISEMIGTITKQYAIQNGINLK